MFYIWYIENVYYDALIPLQSHRNTVIKVHTLLKIALGKANVTTGAVLMPRVFVGVTWLPDSC